MICFFIIPHNNFFFCIVFPFLHSGAYHSSDNKQAGLPVRSVFPACLFQYRGDCIRYFPLI
ncbi:hypothetical protein CLOSTASPAR_03921 [[Clostridium] asparagiforme DSM 15981]|uniref:Uncharacterized protein n=1 Tax=[Clostridium] asparagiforme DSM 15981 TaxID=518636 RepID=C0D3T0_9FIRM|nr:hypothetical protein CLOSTASPAR_03921 [[Clostridium] asparagiforme DSM 15981]